MALLSQIELPDLRMQMQFQREAWERHYPFVSLIRRRNEDTNVDSLNNEAIDPRFDTEHPFQVRGWVEQNPSQQKLMRWGINEPRDVIASFSTVLLDDQNLLAATSQFMIGWLVRFDDDLYEIKEQHRPNAGYWGGTNIPFYFSCTCSRFVFGR